MKVVFRADASNCMGIGHVTRCLTLAESLRQRGADVRFICREHVGHMLDELSRSAMLTTVLSVPTNDAESVDNYAALLGVTQEIDAADTIEALKGEKPDWLIVDHYGVDARWERALRSRVGKLMVIDDLANRYHDCDLLLDQNYSDVGEARYAGLVPEHCRLLLGPRYALLRPEYADWRRTMRPRNGQVRRVLLFFGGSDPKNMTGLALEALSSPECGHLDVNVVVGANNPHRTAIEQLALARGHTTIHGPRPHLADLMAETDISVGAGGATTWERMCLGLPALVVSIANNQKPACMALSRSELIHYVGDVSEVRTDDLRIALAEWIGDASAALAVSRRAQSLVDGLGALRLAEHLNPTVVDHLQLRAARADDAALFFDWVNDPEVRRHSIHSEPICWAHHQKWFLGKISEPKSHMFVLEAGSLPVGQIRFDRVGNTARIDYSLDTLVRGRGWGERLVAMGIEKFHQCERVPFKVAVKVDNISSRRIFLKLGFEELHHKCSDDGLIYYCRSI